MNASKNAKHKNIYIKFWNVEKIKKVRTMSTTRVRSVDRVHRYTYRAITRTYVYTYILLYIYVCMCVSNYNIVGLYVKLAKVRN